MSDLAPEVLKVTNLTKHFPLDRKTAVVAVNDVSFSVRRGESLGLVGESGSGKTTVGRCVLRLLEPTSGRIEFNGREISGLPDKELRKIRSQMQLVFQDPFASLNPRRSVGQTIEEPLTLAGKTKRNEVQARISETLDAVGLSGSYLGRYPAELTASEQQRVGIARAVITRPELIVFDEPTSTLDPSVRAEILDVLINLQERFQSAYIFISHDLTAVETVAHRIAVMYLGKIVEVASSQVLMERQLHPYSKALISAVLHPDPTQEIDAFSLQGEIPTAVNPPAECGLVERCPFAIEQCREGTPPLEPIESDHLSACIRSPEFVAAHGAVPALDTRVSESIERKD